MSVTNVTREELWAKQHLSCKTWIMQYGNGINPCSRSCPESMAAVLSWWMYIKDVMRMLLRVLSIGWGMTGTR